MRTIGLCLILVTAASAQRFSSSSWNVKDHEVTAIFGPPKTAPILTGAPYSADEVQEYRPPDGRSDARIGVIGHFARDSQGRTRMARAYKPAPIWLTEIFDPVAGVAYLLDDQKKIAHRMPLPPAPAASPPAAEDPRTTIEKLGSQQLEGVLAEGIRREFRKSGTSGPPVMTVETWESPELKLTLLIKSSNGYTSRLTNVNRSEPSPSLFQPPHDYSVVDDLGPFPMAVQFQ